ncbi:MAG: hypothetical protein ACYTHK_09755 [Planctomycetota bacterium]|jgi:hypothetical protein
MAKKGPDLRKQVEALQARVEELTAAQAQQTRVEPEPARDDDTGGLEKKFEDLFKTMQDDLDEASGVTVLAVFALGILVGRSLAF